MKRNIISSMLIWITIIPVFAQNTTISENDMDRIELCKQNYRTLFGGEAIYQCAPFIGFPKVLNAVGIINEVFKEKGISLPLEAQATVTEENRHAKGSKIQKPLYGDEIKEAMKALPDGMDEALPDFLTELCFGDFYTRGTLDVKTRELLTMCVLATLGTERQLLSHAAGSIKAGNSKATLYAAMTQCLPYIGFPNALNAIQVIKAAEE